MYDARAVADFFIRKLEDQGRIIYNRTLVNLIYYANGWYYALAGKPLIMQPWKMSGGNPICPVDHDTDYIPVKKTDKVALSVLNRVWEVYSKFSDHQLGTIIQTEESVKHTPSMQVITNEVILKSFQVKRENGRKKRESSGPSRPRV